MKLCGDKNGLPVEGLYLTIGWPDKFVTDAVLGNDDVGRFGIILKFLPEVLDMYAEQVSGVNVGITPDLGEQALVGQYTTFVSDEVIEQLPLGRGKLDQVSIQQDFITIKVD